MNVFKIFKNGRDSMSSLAISPLVSVVLLIAVTMTIAGILTYWATNYVNTSLPDTNQTEMDCKYADFSIYSCTYYNSTSEVNLILENHKNVELQDLKVFFLFSNSSVSNPINLNSTLSAGAMLKSFKIEDVNDGFTKIIVTTNCADISEEKVCNVA